MRRAVVVKALTDEIILVRSDTGEYLSLSVSCRAIPVGSLLHIDGTDSENTGCVIVNINGCKCKKDCGQSVVAMVIEHQDRVSGELELTGQEEKRRVI